jgi:exopolysaccharide biosynthesis WecB/TagA/CpsF family protein
MRAKAAHDPKWRRIFEVPVAALGYHEARDIVLHALESKTFLRINFLNANNANISATTPELSKVLNRSLVLSDGVGLDVASRLLYGAPFPANLNGTDFVPKLLIDAQTSLKIGLLGASREVVDAAAKRFAGIAPQHKFIVIGDGYFSDDASQVERIKAAQLDVLLIGMGTPRQEIWADQFISAEQCTVVMTVGALFDFIAMRVPRAPTIFRDLKLEWLFRLALEPRRLAKRYLVGNPVFLARALKQKFERRGQNSKV